MEITRCTRCMEELGAGFRVCPRCGYEQDSTGQPGNALRRNTILRGRYLVGNVIGQGGFGITYVGWDLTLEMKVAVKEYFPSGAASRTNTLSNQIQWDSINNDESQRAGGMERFLKEARRMARLDAVPSIVRVRDAFGENETAYIVMDFVEGDTLKKHLMSHGVMGYQECINLLSPILDSLAVIHDNGFIHRDISPDNIMIQPDGQARLLDMGAAVDVRANDGQASMAVIKRNFSAPEQYMESEPLGSWTDVYSMAATVYYCMTGKAVPEALEREFKKTPLFFEPGLNIPAYVIQALNDGLELNAKKRIQDMREFKRRLTVLEKKAAFEKKSASSATISVDETTRTEEPERQAAKSVVSDAENPVKKLMNKIGVIIIAIGIGLILSFISLDFLRGLPSGLPYLWIGGIAGGLVIYAAYKTEPKKASRGLYASMAVSILCGWIAVIPFTALYIKLPVYKKKKLEKKQGGKPVPLTLKLIVICSGIWLGVMVLILFIFIARYSIQNTESDFAETMAAGESAGKGSGFYETEQTPEDEIGLPSDWIEGDFGYFTLNDDNTYTLVACTAISRNIDMPDEFNGQPITAVGFQAFAYRSGVEQIRIANSVRTMDEGVFNECDDLEVVFLPSSIETIKNPLVDELPEDSPVLNFFCGDSEAEIYSKDWSDGWDGIGDTRIMYDNSVADEPGYNGWILEDERWRYYEDGFIKTGWKVISGKEYNFNSSGEARQGWFDEDGATYYFDENDCHMVVGWYQIDGDWYYFDDDGCMLRDTTTPDGYWVDEDGICYDVGNADYSNIKLS